MDIPGLVLYGGTIQPGRLRDRDLTVQDVFEAVGAYNAGRIDADELRAVEEHACPGAGACGGQYTANTMSTALEFLGLSPPGAQRRSGDTSRQAGRRGGGGAPRGAARGAGDQRPLDRDSRRIRERDRIVLGDRAAPPTPCSICSRSLPRPASPLEIDDFDAICARTPIIADLRPGGRFVATDVFAAGGLGLRHAAVARARSAAWRSQDRRRTDAQRGRRGGDRDTRTAGDPPRECAPAQPRRDRSAAREPGGRRMRGQAGGQRSRLASRACAGLRFGGGGVRRGSPGRRPRGRRGRHPLRGTHRRPGHARDARGDRRDRGCRPQRLGGADHRRSLLRGDARASWSPTSRRRLRSAARIAAVRDGDIVNIDVVSRRLDVELDDAEIAERLAGWKPPEPRYATGVFAKYAAMVSSASFGAVTGRR